MQDRVSAAPRRRLITPENGQPAFYATIEMADNPTVEGTPLNKASLLTDATAALFGLGTDAVPDDVFRNLPVTYMQYVTTLTIPNSGGYVYFEFSQSDAGKIFILRPSKNNTSSNSSFSVYPVGKNSEGDIIRGGSGFKVFADGTTSSQTYSRITKTGNSEAKIVPLFRQGRGSVPAGSGILIIESLNAKFLNFPRSDPKIFGCSFLQDTGGLPTANMIAIEEKAGATYDLYRQLGYGEIAT